MTRISLTLDILHGYDIKDLQLIMIFHNLSILLLDFFSGKYSGGGVCVNCRDHTTGYKVLDVASD